MRRLVYLADARADLAEIFHYIRSESGSSDIAYGITVTRAKTTKLKAAWRVGDQIQAATITSCA